MNFSECYCSQSSKLYCSQRYIEIKFKQIKINRFQNIKNKS